MSSWWRHQIKAVSALLAFYEDNLPVTGGFPSQRASNAGFGVFFDVSLNKRLNKLSSHQWFETPGCSLWRHTNVAPDNNKRSKSYVGTVTTSSLHMSLPNLFYHRSFRITFIAQMTSFKMVGEISQNITDFESWCRARIWWSQWNFNLNWNISF